MIAREMSTFLTNGCVKQARIPVPRCAFILLEILKLQGNRAVTKDLKKASRIGRKPKSGIEVRIAPCRVIVFKPSGALKERINRPRPDEVA